MLDKSGNIYLEFSDLVGKVSLYTSPCEFGDALYLLEILE